MSKIKLRQDLKESVAAFVAAGGKVSKMPSRRPRWHSANPPVKEKEVVDLSALPEAIRIRFGMRS